MRVGFMGTPAFSVATLDALVEAGHEVVVVVAQPDRPAGRGNHTVSPPTVTRARALGIPVMQPVKVRSGEFPEAFEALALDVAVVVAYGRILTPRLLAAPRLGCVNVHASLLPRWRGAAPIQWSIVAGDDRTGITTMQMAEGLDTGDILLVEETPITAEDTAGTLHDRLAPMGARLLVRTLAEWDRIVPQPQDSAAATFAPILERGHGILDWSQPGRMIDCRVRGLSPWPGTQTVFRGEVLKVLKVGGFRPSAALPEAGRAEPGPLLGGALLGAGRVVCGDGSLELLEVQAAGRKAVRGADWMNGVRAAVGERLGAAAESPSGG